MTAVKAKKTTAKKTASEKTTASDDLLKLDQMNSDIPIARAAILKDFYAVLLASMKKEAKTGSKLT